MNPWPIGAACLLGAGFIAYFCASRGPWWPLTVLSALLAVISLQLYVAFRGDGTYHDLSAWRAMTFTVMPGLAATIVGLLLGLASVQGRVVLWRSWQGVLTLVALVIATGAVGCALML